MTQVIAYKDNSGQLHETEKAMHAQNLANFVNASYAASVKYQRLWDPRMSLQTAEFALEYLKRHPEILNKIP